MSPILALFVLGHGAIGIVILVFIRTMRHEPDLESRRKAVFELNNRPVRIEAGEAEITASKAEKDKIDRSQAEIKQLAVDCIPLDDPPLTQWAYAFLAWVFFEGESALFYFLTAPSLLLGLSPQAWSFSAPLISAAWIALIHVLLGSVISDKHRPARTVRRARTGAVMFGGAIICAVWMILSGRNLSDPNIIEQLTAAGLILLVALLSICSAFCSLVATTVFEARRHEHELERLGKRRNDYKRHIELLERDLVRLKGNPAPDTADQKATASSAAPVGVVITALLLVALLTGVRGSAAAQLATQSHQAVAEVERTSAIPFARTGGCEIVVDVTSSTNHEALQKALDQTGYQLPLIADALACKLFRFVPFAGTPFLSIEELPVPPVPHDDSPSCKDIKVEPGSATARAARAFYPNVKQTLTDNAIHRCEIQKRAETEAANGERLAALSNMGARLRAMGNIQPQGPCTALLQVVTRAMQRSQHLLVVTDGEPTCPPPSNSRITVPTDSVLLFLLVPSKTSDVNLANVLLEHLAGLEHAFPGSRALLGPEATDSFWSNVGRARLIVR